MKERFRMRPSRYVDLVRACAVKISNISCASWPTWNPCPAARDSNPDQTRPAILDLMQVPERVNTLRHLFSPVLYSYGIYIHCLGSKMTYQWLSLGIPLKTAGRRAAKLGGLWAPGRDLPRKRGAGDQWGAEGSERSGGPGRAGDGPGMSWLHNGLT